MDRLSPDLRKAETEIDSEYTKNPLTKQPFATAVWNLLGVVDGVWQMAAMLTRGHLQ